MAIDATLNGFDRTTSRRRAHRNTVRQTRTSDAPSYPREQGDVPSLRARNAYLEEFANISSEDARRIAGYSRTSFAKDPLTSQVPNVLLLWSGRSPTEEMYEGWGKWLVQAFGTPTDQAAERTTTLVRGAGPACTTRLASEISALAELHRDWDGHGAEPISPDAIAHALRFVQTIDHTRMRFEAFPDPNGNVGLQADIGDRVLYLNFSPNGDIAYVIRSGHAVHRGRGADKGVIDAVLKVLV